MLVKSSCVLAGALTLGLGGCVAAVPLGQMAASKMAPAAAPCAPSQVCAGALPAGSFGVTSKGMADSFQKLTGGILDTQTLATGSPVK